MWAKSVAVPIAKRAAGMHLSVTSLGKRFGTQWILRGLSFELPYKRTLWVSGENGTGKSTLCHLLLGFEAPTEGRIQWNPSLPNAYGIAFAAPYVELPQYVSLRKLVKLQYAQKMHADQLLNNLALLGIAIESSKMIGEYSSGVKHSISACV